jgi:PAS domain S-box-containing protein
MAKKSDGSIKFNGLRRQAEKLLQTTRDDVAAMPVKEVQQLVHELQVHQIELDIQNEELRRAHIELEAARDRYADLYDFSPAGHLTLDVSGKIVEANLRAGTMLGVNRKELIGQSFGRFVVLDDRAIFYGHCRESVKSGTRQICEVRLLNRSGASSYVHLESLAVYEEPGHIIHWRTAILDITDRKVVERELKAQQAQLQGIIGSAMDAIITVDEGQRVVLFNRAAESMFLCRATDVIDQMLDQFIPERLRQAHHDQIGAFTLLRTTSRSIEPPGMLFGRRANGEEFPIEASISHIRVDDKNLLTIIIRDVTKRKQAEQEQARLIEELTRSQQHFQSLFNWTPSAVGISTLAEGRFSDVNDGFTRLTGYTREEVIGRTSLELGMWADPWERAVVLREMREQGHLRNREGVLRTKSGEFRSIMISVDPIQVGTTPCLIYLAHDITDRKRAEETLRLAKFSMERAADAVYWIDSQAKILDVNEAASLMLGYSKDELCAMTVHDLNPDFPRDMWPGFWADTQRRGTMVFETAHRAKNGRLIPIEVSVNYLFYEGKEYHCAFVRDITERKRAEEELRRSETFITSVVENLPHMIFVKNAKDLTFVRFNKAGEDLLGHSREVLIGKSDYDLFPKEEADFFTEKDRQVFKTGGLVDIPEEVIETKHQGLRILHTKKIPLCDDNGDPQYLLGISEDITEYKRAETALRESQMRFQAIFDQTFQFIGLMKTDGTMIEVNRSALQFAGIQEQDVLGKLFWDTPWWTHSPDLQDRLREAVRQAAGGTMVRFEATHPSLTGELAYVDFSLKPVRDEHGNVTLLIPEGRDITDRKIAEESLRVSDAFTRAVLNSLSAHVCVLDKEGVIVKTNDAWQDFAQQHIDNGMTLGTTGDNYLDHCHRLICDDVSKNREAILKGVESVLTGDLPSFTAEYQVLLPEIPRWFLLRVTLLKESEGVVISQTDISEQVRIGGLLKQHILLLGEKRVELESLAKKLITTQEAERKRIARELHDDFNQRLAVLSLDLGGLVRTSTTLSTPVAQQLAAIRAQIEQLSEDLHDLAYKLHPSLLEHVGLEVALRDHIIDFAKRTELPVQFTVHKIPKTVSLEIATSLFRVMQESLQNVSKHAQATEVSIRLSGSSKGIGISVRDNGKGFNCESKNIRMPGLGLVSMQERMHGLGGFLRLHSLARNGTKVCAWIPRFQEDP